MTTNKKVKLDLIGLDSNAYALLAAFNRAAKRQGWTLEEIKAVLDEAKSSDHDHLVFVLSSHCEPEDEV